MNRIRNFEVVLDVDDVLLDCNRYALDLLSDRTGETYSIDHVCGWGFLGIPEDERLSFLNDKSFYINQPALPGARDFLRELGELANVTIMTAVYPPFMGERIRRLGQLFPEFPQENIIMGKRKELLQADVILDDGVHNLYGSGLTLPVLYRQPWNRKVSGICSVSSYDAFISLVNIMLGNKLHPSAMPKVLCIVGPSGSGKHRFADELCQRDDFVQVYTCTTAQSSGKNRCLTQEEFSLREQQGFFMETTYYGGQRYGLPANDMDQVLSKGKHAVAVMDISGCMAVHNRYPGQSLILYVERDKRSCIDAILSKNRLSKEETVDRILSFDYEEKNKILADHILSADEDGSFKNACAFIEEALLS